MISCLLQLAALNESHSRFFEAKDNFEAIMSIYQKFKMTDRWGLGVRGWWVDVIYRREGGRWTIKETGEEERVGETICSMCGVEMKKRIHSLSMAQMSPFPSILVLYIWTYSYSYNLISYCIWFSSFQSMSSQRATSRCSSIVRSHARKQRQCTR